MWARSTHLMARTGQQALGTKLRLPSRKELEGEGKCEPCGLQQRKGAKWLRVARETVVDDTHPTLIQLRLSHGNILSAAHHYFWYYDLSFSSRIIPAFIAQCIWNMALVKTSHAHGDQEHSCIPNHTFTCSPRGWPPPRWRANGTTQNRVFWFLNWQNIYSARGPVSCF